MHTKGFSKYLLIILMVVLLTSCSWANGFTIVLPDREIEVTIPKTGVKIPEIELGLSNIDRVRGSGDLTTVKREVHDFDQVSILGSGEVYITIGDVESLTISIEDNLLTFLETEVQAGTLTLGWNPDKAKNKDIKPTRPIRFEIVVKELTGISIYGSAHVEVENISAPRSAIDIFGKGDVIVGSLVSDRVSVNLLGMGYIEVKSLVAENLEVEMPGFGDVELAGEVEQQEVNIAGSGEYRAGDLYSSVAYVSNHGSGDATLWVTEQLSGKVNGSGNLEYYGDPRMNISDIGSGRVVGLGEH